MSNITPFVFEGHNVTVITDDDGSLHFVAMEAAEILGYSDAYEMTKRLDDDEKQNRQIAGFGPRGVTVISESGLYDAILGSTKPEAKPFQKWVRAEVLPSVRKTGSYTLPQAQQVKPARASERYREAAVITREQLKICKLLGVDDGMAKVITAKEVRNVTGLDFTPLLTNITATDNPRLTVKELAERIGGGAKSEQVNAALEQLGFQAKKHWLSKGQPRSKWELTEAGKQYGALAPYQAQEHEHAGYRPVWHADVLEFVQPLVLTAVADRAAAKKPKRATRAAAPAPAPAPEPQGALL